MNAATGAHALAGHPPQGPSCLSLPAWIPAQLLTVPTSGCDPSLSRRGGCGPPGLLLLPLPLLLHGDTQSLRRWGQARS